MIRRLVPAAMAMVAIVAGPVGGLPTSAPRLASAAVGEAHVAVRDGYLHRPASASLSTVNGRHPSLTVPV